MLLIQLLICFLDFREPLVLVVRLLIPVPGIVKVQYLSPLTARVNLIIPGRGEKLHPIPDLLKLIRKNRKLSDFLNLQLAIGLL
jgi:hypothetical protein